MAQLLKISKNNTTIGKDAKGRPSTVWLHSTRILDVDWDKRVLTVCTGGWSTATTRNRLNQAFYEWGLPFLAGLKGGTIRVHRIGEYDGGTVMIGTLREQFEF